jgi:hypothetical protein
MVAALWGTVNLPGFSPKFLLTTIIESERIKGSGHLTSTDCAHVRAQKPFHCRGLQGGTWTREDRINHANAEKFSASIIVASKNSGLRSGFHKYRELKRLATALIPTSGH